MVASVQTTQTADEFCYFHMTNFLPNPLRPNMKLFPANFFLRYFLFWNICTYSHCGGAVEWFCLLWWPMSMVSLTSFWKKMLRPLFHCQPTYLIRIIVLSEVRSLLTVGELHRRQSAWTYPRNWPHHSLTLSAAHSYAHLLGICQPSFGFTHCIIISKYNVELIFYFNQPPKLAKLIPLSYDKHQPVAPV